MVTRHREQHLQQVPEVLWRWFEQLLITLRISEAPAKQQDFPYLQSILAFSGELLSLFAEATTHGHCRRARLHKAEPSPEAAQHLPSWSSADADVCAQYVCSSSTATWTYGS